MANFESFHWNFLSSTNPEIGRSGTVTPEIDTLFHPAIILKIFSIHDYSLRAAWAGHQLLGRLKQL